MKAMRDIPSSHSTSFDTAATSGFTLVELLVSITIFLVVMLVSVGTLLSLLQANQQARGQVQSLEYYTVAFESIIRALREGEKFSCIGAPPCTTIEYRRKDSPAGSDVIERIVYDGATVRRQFVTTGGEELIAQNVPAARLDYLSFEPDPDTTASGATTTRVMVLFGASADAGNGDVRSMNLQTNVTTNLNFSFIITGQLPPPSQGPNPGPGPSGPPPTVTISARPNPVAYGQTVTITWSSTNAVACNASGDWSGAKATGGSEVTAPIVASRTFTLTCTGAGGDNVTDTVVVFVAPPSIQSFSITPSGVTADIDQFATLTWTVTNATACWGTEGLPAWQVSLPVGTNQSRNVAINFSPALAVGTPSFSLPFRLNCSGPGGTTELSRSLTVHGPGSVNLTSSAASVAAVGDSVTLSWTGQNIRNWLSCTGVSSPSNPAAYGTLWYSSSLPASGSRTLQVFEPTTFTIQCYTWGGRIVTSAVSVGVGSLSSAPLALAINVLPSQIPRYGTATVSWSSWGATSCSASVSDPALSGQWSGSKPVGTGQSQSISNIGMPTTFRLECTDGVTTVTREAAVSIERPAGTFTASPTSVASDGATTLTWNIANADSCSASATGNKASEWSGSRPTTGSQTISGVTNNHTFRLTCTGPGSPSTTTFTSTVSIAPPVFNAFAATPATVVPGGSITLTWDVANATACTAFENWSGVKSPVGSEVVLASAATNNFRLECTGPSGLTTTETRTVTVFPPSIAFTASAYTVPWGGATTLNWTTLYADSCVGSGAWTGSKNLTGGANVSNIINNPTVFTLTCTGMGGSEVSSVSIAVSDGGGGGGEGGGGGSSGGVNVVEF